MGVGFIVIGLIRSLSPLQQIDGVKWAEMSLLSMAGGSAFSVVCDSRLDHLYELFLALIALTVVNYMQVSGESLLDVHEFEHVHCCCCCCSCHGKFFATSKTTCTRVPHVAAKTRVKSGRNFVCVKLAANGNLCEKRGNGSPLGETRYNIFCSFDVSKEFCREPPLKRNEIVGKLYLYFMCL